MFPMANRLVIIGIIVRIIKLKSAFLELSPPPTNMTGKAPDNNVSKNWTHLIHWQGIFFMTILLDYHFSVINQKQRGQEVIIIKFLSITKLSITLQKFHEQKSAFYFFLTLKIFPDKGLIWRTNILNTYQLVEQINFMINMKKKNIW